MNTHGKYYYTTGGLAEGDWYGSGVASGVGGGISVSGPPQSTFSNYYDGSGNCTAPPAAQAPATMEAQAGTPAATISSTEASSLLGLVQSLAENAGGSSPSNVEAVATTRAAANRLVSGDTVNSPSGTGQDDTGAYLVEATGNFVAQNGSAPYGDSPPSGSAIWLVVDPNGNTILDWGIAPAPLTASALDTLGPATPLS